MHGERSRALSVISTSPPKWPCPPRYAKGWLFCRGEHHWVRLDDAVRDQRGRFICPDHRLRLRGSFAALGEHEIRGGNGRIFYEGGKAFRMVSGAWQRDPSFDLQPMPVIEGGHDKLTNVLCQVRVK